ncbi:cytochrome P450 [Solwaraspora sp. WMMA2065]|uniref:cytochrome P450 n=1 Tax=Solwaraspora sp. WMMA2065 TaxID=3015166 RepID=UPI00259AF077|nr:cytochrome P450 [Solwaraspora sp. WMMA2065]WJK35473.1 cytochrome P450 [Solwaraspora sp. WMMA2065]
MTGPTPRPGASPAPMRPVAALRVLPGLVRDPLQTLVGLAADADGSIVRLSAGPARLYLVSDPAQVAHVLRDNAANYLRDGRGLLWRPILRLFGDGILSEGPVWSDSRRTLQPLFTARRLDALTDDLATAIADATGPLADAARHGHTVDIGDELARLVCRAIVRVMFADRFTTDQALRITAAQDTIATAVLPRLLLPFVPNAVPLPRDRAFRQAVRTIDDIVLPVVRQARADGDDTDDVVGTLVRGRDRDGRGFDEAQIRNDTVAMFATSTETTYGVLTWLWPLLHRHPAVADRLQREIDEVVGAGPVRREHLPRLRYTRMVLDELLRLYPVAWLIPRTALADDVIDGVRIKAGAQLMVSPYLTHRLPTVWPDPDRFDPDRFDPDGTQDTDAGPSAPASARRRQRYAHFPFGGGPHQCLGQHLFYLEASLIVATILSRFRVRVTDGRLPTPQAGASVRTDAPVRVRIEPAALSRTV